MLKKNILFLVILWLIGHNVFGQQSDNSPYSRFGIGELSDNHFNYLRQMGGLGTAPIDQYHFNVLNPASLSHLSNFSLDVGLFAKYNTLRDGNQENNIWTGNIDYLAFAFPLRNPVNDIYEGKTTKTKFAMSFALMPHSNVSYNILTSGVDENVGKVNRSYIGSGGSYKFLFGNSVKYKNFSFGVNLGYLFGKIDYQRNIDFLDFVYSYQNRFSTNYNIRGFLWNAGMIYSKVINKAEVEKNRSKPSKMISIGVRGNSAQRFQTTANEFDYGIQVLESVVNRDTFKNINDVEGKGQLPAEFAIGGHYYHGEKWSLGFDYQMGVWDQYYNDANDEVKGTLRNTSRIAIGGHFRPNYKSFDNFFERVYYRYGAYYNTDPRVVNDQQLDGYGVSVGFGLPFIYQRKISFVNLGVQYGQRATALPLSERYVKISFGVTFNDDEWFLKSKYY
jgi:hypothetical protein